MPFVSSPHCSVAGVTVKNPPRTDSALTQIVPELPTRCDAYTTAAVLPVHLVEIHLRRRQATLHGAQHPSVPPIPPLKESPACLVSAMFL